MKTPTYLHTVYANRSLLRHRPHQPFKSLKNQLIYQRSTTMDRQATNLPKKPLPCTPPNSAVTTEISKITSAQKISWVKSKHTSLKPLSRISTITQKASALFT